MPPQHNLHTDAKELVLSRLKTFDNFETWFEELTNDEQTRLHSVLESSLKNFFEARRVQYVLWAQYGENSV